MKKLGEKAYNEIQSWLHRNARPFELALWQFYTHRPSEFIWAPFSPLYPGNEEIVEKELDYLIETRKPDGVWDITWTWFDLTEQFPKEFAIAENWWKAAGAIRKVLFLKSFDRI